jgi:hypothetical protein
MEGKHEYSVKVTWTGNCGQGTSDYKSYNRDHVVSIEINLPHAVVFASMRTSGSGSNGICR